eukprot:1661311-Lingulodinium_polyedra.AAC.1
MRTTTGARDADELLAEFDKHRVRSVCGTLSYLALDRPDIQYQVKNLMREVAHATRGTEIRMKH